MFVDSLIKRSSGRLLSVLFSVLIIAFVPRQSVSAQDSEIAPFAVPITFEAAYSLKWRGRSLGEGERRLSVDDQGQYQLSYHTWASMLWFSDEREEVTNFHLKKGVVTPIDYHYTRKGVGNDIYRQLSFDHENKTVTNLRSRKAIEDFAFVDGLQNQLSYQFQLQLDLMNNKSEFVYPAINKDGNPREYKFVVEGEETLTVPYGKVETIRLRRETGNSKRVTWVWVAPSLDYTLVRIRQLKESKENYDVTLKRYTPIAPPVTIAEKVP